MNKTISIFDMECFLRIAECSNLTQAASEIGISQPALSMHLKKIEEEMGALLLNRSSHRMGLTAAGKEACEGFRTILHQYYETLARVQSRQASPVRLRIGYEGPFDWAGIQKLLMIYLGSHSQVDLQVVHDSWHNLLKKLTDEELDFVFTEVSELEDFPTLKSRVLFSEPSCIAVRADHPLAGRGAVSLHDLENQTIFFNNSRSRLLERLQEILRKEKLDPRSIRYENSSEDSVRMAFVLGGAALIPASFGRKDRYPSLRFPVLENDLFRIQYAIAYKSLPSCKNREDFLQSALDYSWTD